MSRHYFLSYSRQDASEFIIRFYDSLMAGPPPVSVWLDQRDIKPGYDWDSQIVEAIKVCEGLIFVMTKDSVHEQSICKAEWTRALKYKKSIIPILLANDVEIPLRFENCQYIDFTGDFSTSMAKLRNHLVWLKTPAGALREMEYRLTAAKRDLARTSEKIVQSRIQDEIKILEKQIANQLLIAKNPLAVAQHVNKSIERGIYKERIPGPPSKKNCVEVRSVNPFPGVAPSHFQDRQTETKLICDFLKNKIMRIITIKGRGGTGKTILVCRVLKNLQKGLFPDNHGMFIILGIINLSAGSSKPISFSNLYAGLCHFLSSDKFQQVDKIYKNPHSRTEDIMRRLLEELPAKTIIVFLDNFESVVDDKSQLMNDPELKEALAVVLANTQHCVKIIITTRILAFDLAMLQPAFQWQLSLDDGLPSPYAENILRDMDFDGRIGLKNASDDLLNQARERTRGYPRALEALFAILAADRDTSLEEILEDTSNLLPDDVMETLIGEAFSRLGPIAQKIMEALALYGIPVTPVAVDYLLQTNLIGMKSALLLKQLVNMHFVRKVSGKYYLHPVDRAYSLSRIPKGSKNDWKGPRGKGLYTRYSLRHRGALYFEQIRKPSEYWRTLDDLEPQLSEFELRYANEEYGAAVTILDEITKDYLHLWGYYQLSSDLHERLLNKVPSIFLRRKILGVLGPSYFRMGKYEKAKKCFEKELEIYKTLNDNINVGKSYGNIGACYEYLGQINRAMIFYHRTLAIARNSRIREWEAVILCNFGNCYSYMGKIDKSIEYLEKSLAIDQELGDRENENITLGNLGLRYATIGNYGKAMCFYSKSLDIAEEIGSKRGEAVNLHNIANLHVEMGNLKEAIAKYKKAITIADDIALGDIQYKARIDLSRAYLFNGNISFAEFILEETNHYDKPTLRTTKYLLVGLIALGKNDMVTAKGAFTRGINYVQELLKKADETYSLFLEKGLIFCGLAVTVNPSYTPFAVESFRSARAIYRDAGKAIGAYSMFDLLIEADDHGVLAPVMKAFPFLSVSK